MFKVMFRADDGPGIGAGHMMRCLALAEEIIGAGGEVLLASSRVSCLHDRWMALGARVVVEPQEIGSQRDLDLLLSVSRDIDADWLVIDGYEFDAHWLDAAAAEIEVLCIDDTGTRDPAVSLVLNHNPGAEQRYDQAYRRCGRALLGLDWFLLRREFQDLAYQPQPRRLLLTLGGEDPENRMLSLMEAFLVDGRPFEADVICSAPLPGVQQATKLVQDHPGFFSLHRSPVPLSSLMSSASVLVSGGGVTPLEAISLGVAPVILVLADNQRPGAEFLSAEGAALVTSIESHSMATVAKLALDILYDDDSRQTITARGGRLTDGRGAHRVLAAMMENSRESTR